MYKRQNNLQARHIYPYPYPYPFPYPYPYNCYYPYLDYYYDYDDYYYDHDDYYDDDYYYDRNHNTLNNFDNIDKHVRLKSLFQQSKMPPPPMSRRMIKSQPKIQRRPRSSFN